MESKKYYKKIQWMKFSTYTKENEGKISTLIPYRRKNIKNDKIKYKVY